MILRLILSTSPLIYKLTLFIRDPTLKLPHDTDRVVVGLFMIRSSLARISIPRTLHAAKSLFSLSRWCSRLLFTSPSTQGPVPDSLQCEILLICRTANSWAASQQFEVPVTHEKSDDKYSRHIPPELLPLNDRRMVLCEDHPSRKDQTWSLNNNSQILHSYSPTMNISWKLRPTRDLTALMFHISFQQLNTSLFLKSRCNHF